jgi:hypothetical protein
LSAKSIEFINVDELIHSALQIKVPSEHIKKWLKNFIDGIGKVPYLSRLTSFINYVTSPEVNPEAFEESLT